MGLYPDLLPGYEPVSNGGKFHQDWGTIPAEKGLTLPEMIDAAKAGNLKALYVVGANPVGLSRNRSFRLCPTPSSSCRTCS